MGSSTSSSSRRGLGAFWKPARVSPDSEHAFPVVGRACDDAVISAPPLYDGIGVRYLASRIAARLHCHLGTDWVRLLPSKLATGSGMVRPDAVAVSSVSKRRTALARRWALIRFIADPFVHRAAVERTTQPVAMCEIFVRHSLENCLISLPYCLTLVFYYL